MENKCRADGLVPVRLLIFPTHVCKGLRLPWKSAARSYEVLHLSRKSILDHLSKPQDRILETATFFRKSAPWPPNISDEHLSCIAPAIQESHACRCFFKMLWKETPRFARFWQDAESLAPATRNDIWTSKIVQKCSVPLSFLHSWLRNVLRATTACTFWTGTRLTYDPTPIFSHMTLPLFCGRVELWEIVGLAWEKEV